MTDKKTLKDALEELERRQDAELRAHTQAFVTKLEERNASPQALAVAAGFLRGVYVLATRHATEDMDLRFSTMEASNGIRQMFGGAIAKEFGELLNQWDFQERLGRAFIRTLAEGYRMAEAAEEELTFDLLNDNRTEEDVEPAVVLTDEERLVLLTIVEEWAAAKNDDITGALVPLHNRLKERKEGARKLVCKLVGVAP